MRPKQFLFNQFNCISVSGRLGKGFNAPKVKHVKLQPDKNYFVNLTSTVIDVKKNHASSACKISVIPNFGRKIF
jgi:hypothetical protein